MTAHGTGEKYVLLAREVCGDEGENFRWDAIDRNKRVSPLADGRQHGRSILVELRNGIEGEPVFQGGRLIQPL